MKLKSDPRHQKRIKIMQQLFTWNFKKGKEPMGAVKEIISQLKKIDKKITDAAPERPLKQVNNIDLAILRLSLYELLLSKDIPPKVVVDEAVELAKEYGGESSPSFVNGVLGKVIETEGIQT